MTLAMIMNVFYDVMTRYLFSSSSLALQEMEWHLFSATFLLGTAYTLKEDAHVRVDIFYDRMDVREKAAVNILGTLFLLIPFATIIVWGSRDFVTYSFAVNEQSPDPGGMPLRWLIKALIPSAYVLVLIQAVGEICRNVLILSDREIVPGEKKRHVIA